MEIDDNDGNNFAIIDFSKLSSPLKVQTWNGLEVRVLDTAKHSLVNKEWFVLYIPPEQVPSLSGREITLLGAEDLDNDDEDEIDEESEWEIAESLPYFSLVDLENPTLEEILAQRGFVFDNGTTQDIKLCGFWKKLDKKRRHASHKLTKGYKKTVEFVKEHKKEILIGAAVLAAGAGGAALILAYAGSALESSLAAAVAGALAANQPPSRKREEEAGDSYRADLKGIEPPQDPQPHKQFDPKSIFPVQLFPQAPTFQAPYLDKNFHTEPPPPPTISSPVPPIFSSQPTFISPQSVIPNVLFRNSAPSKNYAPYLNENAHRAPTIDNKAPDSHIPSIEIPRPVETPSWVNAVGNTFKTVQELAGSCGALSELLQSQPSNKNLVDDPQVAQFLKSVGQTLKAGFETIGRGMQDRELLEFSTPLDEFDPKNMSSPAFVNPFAPLKGAWDLVSSNHFPDCFDVTGNFDSLALPVELSRHYVLEGIEREGMSHSLINGMGTSFEEAIANAKYLQQFTSNFSIKGVYNHSNAIGGDIIEIMALNYAGISPLTKDLLMDRWTEFHEKNKHNPHSKLLHFCHSQGALHTINALNALPKEIRDRVIVVAIAPAAVVSRELCYQSFNYASKRDFVPFGGFVQPFFISMDAVNNIDQLIRLEPHPDASLLHDHAFVSPTFKQMIITHIEEYEIHKGQYP